MYKNSQKPECERHKHFIHNELLFILMFHTNPAKKGCACNAAFNMLHARLCTCRTDYIDIVKPE